MILKRRSDNTCKRHLKRGALSLPMVTSSLADFPFYYSNTVSAVVFYGFYALIGPHNVVSLSGLSPSKLEVYLCTHFP